MREAGPGNRPQGSKAGGWGTSRGGGWGWGWGSGWGWAWWKELKEPRGDIAGKRGGEGVNVGLILWRKLEEGV